MRTACCLLLLSLAACRSKSATDPMQDPVFLGLTRIYKESFVSPMCGRQPSPPSTQAWSYGPIRGKQRCGMLAMEFVPDDDDWRERFFAQLQERYQEADARWHRNHCVGYPDSCRLPGDIEAAFLREHNDKCWAMYEERVNRLVQARYPTSRR